MGIDSYLTIQHRTRSNTAWQCGTARGVSLILSNGALLVFGSAPQTVRMPVSSNAWALSPSPVSTSRRSSSPARWGKIPRAASDNPEAATYIGIDVDRACRLAFGIGAAVTGVSPAGW